LIAAATDVLVYAIFLVVNGSVIALWYRSPGALRLFRIPWSIGRMPLLPLLGSLMVLSMLPFLDPRATAVGVALIAAGAVAWVATSARRHR
jgi:APA family basic amino acid/polyamine antiporter